MKCFGLTVLSLCLAFGLADGAGRAEAQTIKREKPEKPKTRRSEVLGKTAFQRIEQAQNLLAEEKYEAALAPLQALVDGADSKPYEKAVALQTMGFVYAGKGDWPRTIEMFSRAIATGDLPPRVVSDLTYNLAQINLAQNRPDTALELLEQWFAALETPPSAAPLAFKAQVHLRLEQWRAAETAIRTALSKAKPPKQHWVRILLAVLLQEERYAEARPILEDAVTRWPNVKAFWQQLTLVYYEADEEQLAFVAQQAMHVQGLLSSSQELSTMAQLYLYHDVPIKAAAILQSGMDDGTIEKTEKNYALLAQAYRHAREWKKSIPPLLHAAEKSETGGFYEQLAQSYVQDEQWAKAEAALVQALDKGGLARAADAWLLLGISRTRLEKYDAAIRAFRKAGADDDLAEDAFRWIRSIERRLAAG